MVGKDYSFSFTDAEYAKYEEWCHSNKLDGYSGAIGGSTSFDITPTSLGEISNEEVVRDELGEPSYDKNGKLKKKRIECVIRDII